MRMWHDLEDLFVVESGLRELGERRLLDLRPSVSMMRQEP